MGLSKLREDEKEISQLGTFVVLEYIKSAIEIILNLKFEDIEHRLRESSHSQVNKAHAESEMVCENVFSPRIAAQLFSSTSSI